jgi:hypothetical protein
MKERIEKIGKIKKKKEKKIKKCENKREVHNTKSERHNNKW